MIMKNFKTRILLFIISILLVDCASEKVDEPIKIDDSYLYDQDGECSSIASGLCCDVDGRILVEIDKNYSYNYESKFSGQSVQINWQVLEGSITIISGQNTNEAVFKFNTDFTAGKIKAFGEDELGNSCSSTISISKL